LLGVNLLDGPYEAIAAARNRFDEGAAIRSHAENLSQGGYVLDEGAFFDKGIRPNAFEEFVLFQDVPVVFDEREQSLKGLGSQRNELAVSQEKLLRRIQSKATEVKEPCCSLGHGCFQNSLREI
jgi:hypothetical protein